MDNKRIIIAIDGHSSCGKSTFAKAIAARLGYIFIDTGAMYRAVTLEALNRGVDLEDPNSYDFLDEISIIYENDKILLKCKKTNYHLYDKKKKGYK